jgi:hypothetical protein
MEKLTPIGDNVSESDLLAIATESNKTKARK